MLRSILIGLDGSDGSTAAVDLGIRWARRTNALLVGIGIVDEPTIARAAPVMIGGPPYTDPVLYRQRLADARRQIEQFLESFALRCSGEEIAFKLLEDVGLPAQKIVREAQRYDAILLGTPTRFHFETQEGVDDTISRVIRDGARPVVVVPAKPRDGRATLVAFDGSVQAARALQAFVETGLDEFSSLHVVSAADDKVEAARTAERAVDFLRNHGIKAVSHAFAASEPLPELILHQASKLDAGLIVLGAFGQPSLKEFFLGSVTRTLLRESPVPLFLSH